MNRRHALAFAAICCIAAALAIPGATDAAPGVPPAVRVLRVALGPFRGLVAELLRIRSSYARDRGDAEESIRLQLHALEIEPSTDAALTLASEAAYDLPSTGATQLDPRALAQLGIDILQKARALGNGNPRLLDAEAQLLLEKRWPRTDASPSERLAALDGALALSLEVARTHRAGHLRAAAILEERGLAHFAASRWAQSEADWRNAADHEAALLRSGFPEAASREILLRQKARLAAVRGAGGGASELAAIVRSIEALNANDPVLPLAK
jgi:hypothetical protein